MVRILVIQTAFLGDVVLTTPLFRELKALYPTARVDCLVSPRGAEILQGLPELDTIIVHNKKRRGLRDLGRILAKVRANGYEIVLSPHRSVRSAVVARLSGAKQRIGYRESALTSFYNRLVKRPADLHETARILELTKPLGGAGGTPRPHLTLTDEEILFGKSYLEGQPTVVLAPGSEWATKRWPAAEYGALAARLSARGYRVVIIGSGKDKDISVRVAEASGRAAVNLAGRTTVRQMASLVAASDLLVANDSAPVHIAAAFNTPTIAIYGPTVPEMGFGPLSAKSRSLGVGGLYCRPCGPHGGNKCPEGHFRCMEGIDEETVTESALYILEGRPAPAFAKNLN